MKWTSRRRKLRTLLADSRCIHPASTFDPLSARIAQELGYEMGILAGSTASLTVLGAPDLAVLTATELASQASRICRAAELPLLVDADHGYGNALNVARTIEELEMAGAAAATIEDTALPAPFGAKGKARLVSLEEGIGKIKAALAARVDSDFMIVGRTSAPLISNLNDTINRLRAYERVGVDALFIVGVKTIADLSAISAATTSPLILGTISPELEGIDLAASRVRICLQGHLPMFAAIRGIYETMKALKDGIPPSGIENVASTSLLEAITREDTFREAALKYLI